MANSMCNLFFQSSACLEDTEAALRSSFCGDYVHLDAVCALLAYELLEE